MSVVIAGGGSIGTVLAVLWQIAGISPIVLRRSGPTGRVPIKIVGEREAEVTLQIENSTAIEPDYVFITVQEQHTGELCRQLPQKIKLGSSTILVSLQNGTKANKAVLDHFPDHPVLAGTVWWSATLIDYHTVLYHRSAETVVGIPPGSAASQSHLEQTHDLLATILSVSLTVNLETELRKKLVLNVVSPVLALVKQPYPEGLANTQVREMVHALLDEALETADLFDWDLDDQRLERFHQQLVTGSFGTDSSPSSHQHKVSTQVGIEKYGGGQSNVKQLLGWLQLSGSVLADELIQLVSAQPKDYEPLNPARFRFILDSVTYARCQYISK